MERQLAEPKAEQTSTSQESLRNLTDRELEVLRALAAGKTNKEIAESLGISAKTAGHHVQHILDKTGARTRTAATVWAFERQLVQAA